MSGGACDSPRKWHILNVSLHKRLACVPVQALGTKVLPQLWAHLGQNMGLPLEAPKEARRGWDVAALRRGAQGILSQHAALLGVFCRYVADQSRPCTCP